jgi:hypothetical protein
VLQGYGVGGSNATCVELGPKQGGLTLACRDCEQSGYQPFASASAIQFWLRDMNGSSSIPNLQVGFAPLIFLSELSGTGSLSLESVARWPRSLIWA